MLTRTLLIRSLPVFTLSRSVPLSLSLTHSLTLSRTLSYALVPSHTLTLSCSLTLSHSLTYTLSLSGTLSRAHAHSLTSLLTRLTHRQATKGKREEIFYTMPEYENWKESLDGAPGWKIKYYKGLGTNTPKEAKEYFRDIDQHRLLFDYEGDEADELIDMAFNKKKADDRKDWILSIKVCALFATCSPLSLLLSPLSICFSVSPSLLRTLSLSLHSPLGSLPLSLSHSLYCSFPVLAGTLLVPWL